MKFSDIPGHEDVKERLRTMVESGKLPHALLLEGPEGIGKNAMAHAFVQYLHCTNRTPLREPCGQCAACRQHASHNHIDTQYIYPVVKAEGSSTAPTALDYFDLWKKYTDGRIYFSARQWADTFGKKNSQPRTYVTQSSELIRRLNLTSANSAYKAVVWWQPEKMVPEAANKMLKLVEEPYADTIFVFVSSAPMEILPTIYSRVQRIAMRRLPDELIARELMATHSLAPEAAQATAHLADGNMLRAIEVIDQSEQRAQFLELFKQLMRLAYQRNVAALRKWAGEINDLGRERSMQFYTYVVAMLRENFMFNLHVPQITYLSTAESAFSQNFARFITVKNVEKLIAVANDAITDIAANGNGKIINFDVAIKVILLLKQ